MKNTCDFLLFLLFLAVIPHITSVTADKQCRDYQYEKTEFQNPPDGVCSSMHITSYMNQFKKLENCTVVEGYLRISLMENVVHEDYEKWSFPLLREVTAYVSLYRVYGLKSLRHMFPNLAVIGGRQLFNNYALVAFEMPDLEELGLVSLRTISRGGVRMTRSNKLCYLDTVDWDQLGVDSGAQDFREERQCAHYCPDDCPITAGVKRCWTSQHCQQGLNCQCRMNQTCMENGACCHEYCLGGCSGPGPEDCFSCKGVTYQDRCHVECPPNTYMYADRRCLTAKECFALVNNTENGTKNTKILRSDKAELRVCVVQCPQNYTVQEEGEFKNLECVRCQGFCPKVCNGSEVSNIENAQRLKDCSKIVGHLAIQIMGGSKVADELEKSLGNIKEVTGFIFIGRSYALVTLYFLKSLEIIGGEVLYNDKSSFIVMDNSNLVDLFPEEQMKKMKIKNGIMSFHTNRKLCRHKITSFVKHVNLSEAKQEIGAENGNLMPCIEYELSLNVTHIFYNTVVLNWSTMPDLSDNRQLLAYIVYYKEIKSLDEEINIYEGREACYADAWMTNEVLPADKKQPFQAHDLKTLKAYTNYAVYVQAYTLSSATHSAMTAVKTFKTKPYYPTEPLDLEVTSDDPHELHVKWKPPKFPNGIVTHYKVLYQKQELDIKSFEKRDYCNEPIIAPSGTKRNEEEEAEKMHNASASCCPCPKSKEEREAEARKQEIEIYFENYLHDQVYCERYDALPADIRLSEFSSAEWLNLITMDKPISSRNITNNKSNEHLVPYNTTAPTLADNSTQEVAVRNNLTVVIQEVIVNDTDIYLPNLDHFQEYSIEVQACHETIDTIGKLCSNRALTAGRTEASGIMDKLNESTIVTEIIRNVTVDVVITWEPPPKPNGLILTYNILYKRANQENYVPQKVCVNISHFQKHSGYRLTGLDPGNWTFQIIAFSLGGNGSYTSEKYFIVPHIPDDDDDTNEIIITIVVIVIVLLLLALAVWFFIKSRLRKDAMTVISQNENYLSSEPMYTKDSWEVDRDKIKLLKELGQGSFGMVYEGVAKGLGEDPDEEIRVAVKTVNDRASFNDKREFLKEATTMKAFDCFHVVKLLGVVSSGQPALVIMELMALGDLKNYLREHRVDEIERPGVSSPKVLDILQMAGEIADGMAYLADKKFVHRDLAARNCMVAEDMTVKIGDFGMTRDIYETDYYRKGGKGMLPVRWMAPESLKDGVFTSMSDVWSYGVVMWEMVTLAAQPYQGLSNEEVVIYISEGRVMDVPIGSPTEMKYLMEQCWAKKPQNRLTFKQIIWYLHSQLNPRFEKVSYFFNEGGGPRDFNGSDDEDIYETEGSEDAGSYEAAAASPHSGGSASVYDDDFISSNRCVSDDAEAGHFYHQRRDCNIHNECGLERDDSSQPFISGDLQAKTVTMWHSPPLSHDQSGTNSTLLNSGLMELQPLINKDYGPTSSSSRLNSVQSSHPHSSEHIGHHPPIITTYDLRTPSSSQTLLQQHKTAVTDDLQSGSPFGTSHLGQSNWPSSAKPTQSSMVTRPTLRLPTLNQPPSGGFQRLQGDKNSYSSSSQRYNQPSSSGWGSHQPVSATANIDIVTSEEETSPSSTTQQNFPPLGAITSSSDDSKGSSKSSDSHSHINGLTNGHIPMMRHRKAPC